MSLDAMTAGSGRVHVVGEDVEQLTLTCDFPTASPERLYDFWTRADLLRLWWPQEAVVDARLGGEYRLSWPKMGWVLRGRYTQVRPCTALDFTWRWEHETEDLTRDVALTIMPLGERGSRLTLVHSPYADGPEEAAQRQSHLDGWTHFLGRLSDVLAEIGRDA